MNKLRKYIDNFSKTKILVIGDLMVDEYIFVHSVFQYVWQTMFIFNESRLTEMLAARDFFSQQQKLYLL